MLCSVYNSMEHQLFTVALEQQYYDKKNMIWITRIETTRSRVVCYWNMCEVKEGKLKYNKERIRKTSQTMQLNREIKQGKLNIRMKNLKNTNNIKVAKIMKK